MSTSAAMAPLTRRPRIDAPVGLPVWDHRPVVAAPHRALVLLHRLAHSLVGDAGLRVA